jgi:hypothetical protein
VYHAGSLPEGSKEGNSFIVMDYLKFGRENPISLDGG